MAIITIFFEIYVACLFYNLDAQLQCTAFGKYIVLQLQLKIPIVFVIYITSFDKNSI